MESVAAAYPHPDHVSLHAGDTHRAGSALLHNGVHAGERPGRTFAVVEDSGAMARNVGAKLIRAAGNHVYHGQVRAPSMEGAFDDSPPDREFDPGRLRLLVLDSSVPGFQDLAVAAGLRIPGSASPHPPASGTRTGSPAERTTK